MPTQALSHPPLGDRSNVEIHWFRSRQNTTPWIKQFLHPFKVARSWIMLMLYNQADQPALQGFPTLRYPALLWCHPQRDRPEQWINVWVLLRFHCKSKNISSVLTYLFQAGADRHGSKTYDRRPNKRETLLWVRLVALSEKTCNKKNSTTPLPSPSCYGIHKYERLQITSCFIFSVTPASWLLNITFDQYFNLTK